MAEEEKEEKKSNKGLIIAIVGILVLLILAIAVVVFVLLGGKETPSESPSAPQTQEERPQSMAQRSDYAKLGPTFAIPTPFIVNLMGQNGRRYVKASIALELSTPELQKEVTAKLAWIKDRIISVMSSKTFEEISTPKGRDKLKEEIMQEINAYMVDGYIKSVLFSEFIIQ